MAQTVFTGLGWRSSSPDRESARQALTGSLDVDSTGTRHVGRGLGLFSKKYFIVFVCIYNNPTLHLRMILCRNQNWAIQRHGVQGNYLLYWNDLFHTLLNVHTSARSCPSQFLTAGLSSQMPRYRFVAVFFGVYTLQVGHCSAAHAVATQRPTCFVALRSTWPSRFCTWPSRTSASRAFLISHMQCGSASKRHPR
jgi:hypothetical protein